MTLLVCWVVFPAVLAILSLGCGLLVERASGIRLPGALVLPVGFALFVIAAQVATSADATAELATPLVVVLAIAGIVLGDWRGRRLDLWAVGAAVAVFAFYAAPVVLTGEPTFTGYIKLDDTTFWFELTDRVMEHGRNLDGLPPSTYEASLEFNLARGYPVGTFLPFGVGAELVGQDVAWVFQPYEAFIAAMLTLTLVAIAGTLLESRPGRAIVAFIAAQSALLFGYALWGGVKEMAAALIVALIASLLFLVLRPAGRWRSVIPLAVAISAAASLMSPAGTLAWGLPLLLPAFVATFGTREGGGTRRWLALGGATLVLTLPWVFTAGFKPPTVRPLTSDEGFGNLYHELNPLQLVGIWPTGDFRVDPDWHTVTLVLIGFTLVAAAMGLYIAWRQRAWSLILYIFGAILGGVAIFLIASPWVGAKALAIASPAILVAAGAAVVFIVARTRHPAGLVALVCVAAGVVASNVLAYREASIAPRDRFLELEEIGEMLEGKGLTVTPENEPYSSHHFLRQGDPTGVSAYRRHRLPLRVGGTVPKGTSVDLDELVTSADREGLLAFRTIVMRRSPVASRPPAPYRHVWSGDYYEVWRRPASPNERVISHLALGSPLDPNESAPCGEVERLAREAGLDGRVAASIPPEAHVFQLVIREGKTARAVTTEDTVVLDVTVPREGDYELWIGGRTRGEVEVFIDGREVGDIEQALGYIGHYMSFGDVNLSEGEHRVRVVAEQGGPEPGRYGPTAVLGPLVLSPVGEQRRLVFVEPTEASSLCGRELDWIEALGPA
jgi:hypothetical protein